MVVRFRFSALKQSRWYEYALRFFLGGLATVVAGVVADSWGPAVGGLFLAVPAIFCASATLIEKHERRRKEKKGVTRQRARQERRGARLGRRGPWQRCAGRVRRGHVASRARDCRRIARVRHDGVVSCRDAIVVGGASCADCQDVTHR